MTARLIADMITLAGANRVLTIDLHADQLQGFFNIPVDHLYARAARRGLPDRAGAVRSGRRGRLARRGGRSAGAALAQQLDAGLAIIAKRRPEPNKSEIFSVIGEVQGAHLHPDRRHDPHGRLHRAGRKR